MNAWAFQLYYFHSRYVSNRIECYHLLNGTHFFFFLLICSSDGRYASPSITSIINLAIDEKSTIIYSVVITCTFGYHYPHRSIRKHHIVLNKSASQCRLHVIRFENA